MWYAVYNCTIIGLGFSTSRKYKYINLLPVALVFSPATSPLAFENLSPRVLGSSTCNTLALTLIEVLNIPLIGHSLINMGYEIRYDDRGTVVKINSNDYFYLFWQCLYLKNELNRCVSFFRPLGACGPVIMAANTAEAKLEKLRILFEHNTKELYPRYPSNYFPCVKGNQSGCTNIRDILSVFSDFRSALKTLHKAFEEVSLLFHDEKLLTDLVVLPTQLKNDENFIRTQIGHGRLMSTADRAKIHNLLPQLGKGISFLSKSLRGFLLNGVSVIKAAQESEISRYQVLMASSTFLAGVAASMIQITNTNNADAAQVATNALFLSSMALSVGTITSSMLTMAWLRSFVRSPDRHLPPIARHILMRGPTIFLSAAGITFSIGLCCFVIDNNQNLITTLVTIVITVVIGTLFVTLAGWFIIEKWRVHDHSPELSHRLNPNSISLALFSWALDSTLPPQKPAGETELHMYGSPNLASAHLYDPYPDYPTHGFYDTQGQEEVDQVNLALPAAVAFGIPGTTGIWRNGATGYR